MLCDNPNKPEFCGCNYCGEHICYCTCNSCNTCYCKCQFCEGPHSVSVFIYLSDSDDDFDDDSDNDSDDSISSGCHTDSNPESSTEYSDLSITETVTIDEQPISDVNPFLRDILNIPNSQLLTQTDNPMRSMNHAQTQTDGQMMIVNRDEFEILEKVYVLHSYLSGTAVDN